MIIACPKCDSLLPINPELAIQLNSPEIACPTCNHSFNPSLPEENEIDLRIEEITRQLLSDKNRQRTSEKLCEDC